MFCLNKSYQFAQTDNVARKPQWGKLQSWKLFINSRIDKSDTPHPPPGANYNLRMLKTKQTKDVLKAASQSEPLPMDLHVEMPDFTAEINTLTALYQKLFCL